jgi:alpha-tubulin suppressor-like RCC1 family protein
LTSKGQIYSSSKADPIHASPIKSRLKFTDISAADYFVGIAENGRLYIWGKYNEESYDEPI